jgi:hypothetical protein
MDKKKFTLDGIGITLMSAGATMAVPHINGDNLILLILGLIMLALGLACLWSKRFLVEKTGKEIIINMEDFSPEQMAFLEAAAKVAVTKATEEVHKQMKKDNENKE